MKISYKPHWKAQIEKNMRKRDLPLHTHLITDYITKMAKENIYPCRCLYRFAEFLIA